MDPVDLDLVALRVLAMVGDGHSLTEAARRLGVTQQAVSARVKKLEARLGVTLVARGAQGARLTDTGVLVAGWAGELLASADRVATSLATLRGDAESRLTVAASLTIAEHLMPRWLRAMRQETGRGEPPEVRLVAANSTEVVERVREGWADLGFVETPEPVRDVEYRIIGSDDLAVVVAPGHPWARRRGPITARGLASTPLVLREPGSGTRSAFEYALGALPEPLAPVAPAAELPTAAGIRLTAIEEGLPAVVSRRAVEEDLEGGRLVEVPVSGVRLTRPLAVIWAEGTRLSRAAEELLRHVLAGPPG
ncbi:LysR family transcriptional regulator [Nocardiopsis alba]|uniref:LysR family transcriptional regulator n=2 Tax=Nocardiopsis alba TaxID=53437 RepID=A0ABV5DY77_9ACTN|nr:LysR family transcriptional regulator [Nocardiopsis alba]AFR05822.1 bacterial regulatory helix-turn-helix, lysR family protein [Nocardiopsis alba ATCC BAA-2165]